jgi:hypothetical protein
VATLITGSGVDKVIDGSITSTKIADGTITSTKIADGTITNADINASAAIVASKLSGVEDNTPAFLVRPHGGGQTIAANTWSKVTWAVESIDTNGDFANSKFTPSVAGKYFITAQLVWSQIDDNNHNHLQIRKNGTTGSATQEFRFYSGNISGSAGGEISSMPINFIMDTNGTTDYFELWCYQYSGNRNIQGSANMNGSYFAGFKVGGA